MNPRGVSGDGHVTNPDLWPLKMTSWNDRDRNNNLVQITLQTARNLQQWTTFLVSSIVAKTEFFLKSCILKFKLETFKVCLIQKKYFGLIKDLNRIKLWLQYFQEQIIGWSFLKLYSLLKVDDDFVPLLCLRGDTSGVVWTDNCFVW